MTTPANRGMRRSFIILVIIGILMNGAVLLFGIRSVGAVRRDVCAFAAGVSAGAHRLPQDPGRVQAEHAYAQLQERLQCP